MSLTISLAPSGKIQVHLPGASDSVRKVELSPGYEAQSLFRILQAQLREGEAARFESDAEPSSSLLYHQENHQLFPVDTCAICRDQAKHLRRRSRRHLPSSHEAGRGVQVRVIPRKGSKITKRIVEVSLEELGL